MDLRPRKRQTPATGDNVVATVAMFWVFGTAVPLKYSVEVRRLVKTADRLEKRAINRLLHRLGTGDSRRPG